MTWSFDSYRSYHQDLHQDLLHQDLLSWNGPARARVRTSVARDLVLFSPFLHLSTSKRVTIWRSQQDMAPRRPRRQESPALQAADGHINEPSVTQGAMASPVRQALVSNSASSYSSSSSSFHPHQRIIATFSGQNEAVYVDAWLSIFDLVLFDKRDEEKKNLVVRHLDGDALTWFAHHVIPILPSLDWIAVKKLFITRFQNVTVRPLIAAGDLYLKPTGSVTQYYNDKMRLLQRTSIADLDQVALLTKGMPPKYKNHFIASSIAKASEWLLVALELEANFKKIEAKASFLQKSEPFRPHRAPIAAQASQAEFKRDPRSPPPCRFCKEKGIEANHWHAVCSNNPNPKPRRTRFPTETANVSENSEGGRF